MSKGTLYKIRDQTHEILGSATEEEILKRIKRGKFTGDEEVSSVPFEDWHKLSAHPVFYDAFLRRLYDDQYRSPDAADDESDSDSLKVRGKTSRLEKATRQAEPGKTEQAEPAAGGAGGENGEPIDGVATSQLRDPLMKDGGATMHQSWLNELFPPSEEIRKPDPEPEPERELEPPAPLGTDIIPIEAPPEASPDLEKPLDFAAGVSESESPEFIARKKKRERRRRLIWASVLGALLLLLFQMGKDPAKETKSVPQSAVSKPDPIVMADPVAKEERIKALVEEGDRLFEADVYLFYSGALDHYRTALAYDDANILILGRVALAASRLLAGSSDKAALEAEIQQTIEKGRRTEPQFSQFYRAEALVALAENKLDDARKFISNAVETDPASNENAMISAEVSMASGDLSSAKQSLDDVLKSNMINARAHFDLAQIAYREKDLDTAKTEALSTLKINPLHPAAYFLLGEISSTLSQGREARFVYESAGRLSLLNDPLRSSETFVHLATLDMLVGDKKSAERDYLLAYRQFPQNPNVGNRIKGMNSSAANLDSLAAEYFYQPNYFEAQSDNLVLQKKYREAIIFLQAAYLTDTKSGLPLVKLGELYEKLASSYDDFRTVAGFYQRAIDRDRNPRAYIRLGLLETDQYNFDKGYQELIQAFVPGNETSDPYVALGKHFYKRQDYNEALNQFLKASRINPNDSEIVYYAGLLRLLYKKDSVKDSISYFYRAYTLNPQNYDALVEWLKLKVVDFEKNFAIKFVKNLLLSDPNNGNLYWALGEIYAANKEHRRAIDYYHKSLDLDNRASKVRMSLAKSLEAIGDLEKSVAEYRLASFLDRKNSEGFFRAADLLFQIRNYSQAEEVLRFLVSGCPNYPGAHRYLSKIAQIRQQKDVAVAEMKKEVVNNPQNPKFRLELAELYMDYQKLDEAVAELSEVSNLPSVSKAPEFLYDKIRSYLLLARAYRMQGKLEGAEGSIRLALEIDNNDPELHRELGYVYHDMQRDKEGADAFQFYLSREPAARDADKIKTLIQQMVIEE